MRTLVRPQALVESWFDMLPEAQRPLARQLQQIVQQAVPALAQTVKWGNLVFMLDGANLIAIVPHRSHINLQFFNGAALAEQWRQLDGSNKGLRHLKLRYGMPVDEALIAAIARDSADEARA